MSTASNRVNWKVVLVSLVALVVVGGVGVGAWLYPPILLYALIAFAGVTAYVAVYFLVASAMRRQPLSPRPQEIRRR